MCPSFQRELLARARGHPSCGCHAFRQHSAATSWQRGCSLQKPCSCFLNPSVLIFGVKRTTERLIDTQLRYLASYRASHFSHFHIFFGHLQIFFFFLHKASSEDANSYRVNLSFPAMVWFLPLPSHKLQVAL